MKVGLDRLFRPKSIAAIGGGRWCKNVITKCQEIGFAGKIYPVHPSKATMEGVACYSSIEALPEAPDACFVGVNRNATIEIIRQLREKGAGGAVCFASGFLEAIGEDADGADLQVQLLEAAGGMTLIGPNCYGFVNYLDGALLWPDQHGGVRIDRGVAIITQSSNIAINLTMQKRGLPVAYVVTAGNQAQTGFSEIGAALLEDDRVTALGLHIEGIDDLRAFEKLSKTAHDLGKSVVVLKVGKSDQAQAATISHTASLAGSDAGAGALFNRLGFAQVRSLPELLETLKILHTTGPLENNQIASMSCSGGEASLMADTAIERDLVFPDLTDTQHESLRAALGQLVKLANPLDYHTYIWGDLEAMSRTFTAMMEPHLGFGMLILDFPRDDRCDPAAWDGVIDAVEKAREISGRPMGIVSSLTETLPETIAKDLIEKGIVPLCGLDEALRAIEAAAFCGRKRKQIDPVLLPVEPHNVKMITEYYAKAALKAHDVRVPKAQSADDVGIVGAIAEQIGFPVVLKGQGIAHKSEAGAIVLNLATPKAVYDAALAMPTDSFLIEEMVTNTVAELLIGVVLDPAHGYVLTLASGGVLTELLTDSQSLLIPVNETDIENALQQLKISALLNGFRGKPAANMNAIVAAVMAVQDYVIKNAGTVQEVEINPLLCTSDHAIAADALIAIGDKNDG
ncbi:acetate--CoA ligase family protein [Amylibacter sp. SFDW26]|uniref:acetate--CoA ligase family protein n=1 Tax=Amylibacter sp. SFDW26 TaxID=2652722 RepID=UPI001261E024|nr:acetate--CoA ligase family protein [Amylibacter sp. SFDW26]KAB7616022.1 acetate--CoA ligase family protein [Amylibacter sp. SFDW26]